MVSLYTTASACLCTMPACCRPTHGGKSLAFILPRSPVRGWAAAGLSWPACCARCRCLSSCASPLSPSRSVPQALLCHWLCPASPCSRPCRHIHVLTRQALLLLLACTPGSRPAGTYQPWAGTWALALSAWQVARRSTQALSPAPGIHTLGFSAPAVGFCAGPLAHSRVCSPQARCLSASAFALWEHMPTVPRELCPSCEVCAPLPA